MENQEVYNRIIEASRFDISKLKSISDKSGNRIPKIVHFCFLDYRNITEKHLNYIKTWFEVLDDSWTFVNWTPELSKPVCEIEEYFIDTNRFAFYSDYIRCAKIYEYGGVYLDCDVKVLKPFDTLLDLDYCLDTVFESNEIEYASFLSKKNQRFFGILKNTYENKTVQDYFERPGIFLAPLFFVKAMTENNIRIDFKSTSEIDEYKTLLSNKDEDVLYTLDGRFLSCSTNKKLKNPAPHCFEKTFTSHGFETTWSY